MSGNMRLELVPPPLRSRWPPTKEVILQLLLRDVNVDGFDRFKLAFARLNTFVCLHVYEN